MNRQIGLKWSNAGIGVVCAVCGSYHETDIGLELFTDDGGLVCDACGWEQVPELMLARGILRSHSKYFQDVMTENYEHELVERIPADWKNEFHEVFRIATARE